MTDGDLRPRFEIGLAAVFFAILAAWFTWTPITRLGSETLSPVDVLQRSEWSAVDPSWRPGNDAQSDVATEVHASYARRPPQDGGYEWDRFTGFGSPASARPTASALSPFAWLHRVLPLDRAALVEAIAKLFLAGFLAYGFLRALRLASIACLFGAVSFMFSGTLLEHLARPTSAVAVAIVGGLWVIESLARRIERDRPREAVSLARLAYPLHAAGFAAVVVFGVAAGDLSAFAWALCLWASFAFVRAWSLWRSAEPASGAGIAIASIYAQYALLGILAIGTSGVFLATFVEFSSQSWILRERLAISVAALAHERWSTALFPQVLGDPAHLAQGSLTLFTGLSTFFCALFAVCVVRGRKVLVYFGVAALAWLALAFDLFGLQELLLNLPVFRLVSFESGSAVFHVAIAVCAALLVHRLYDRRATRAVIGAVITLCAALIVLFVARAGASHLVLQSFDPRSPIELRSTFANAAAHHIQATSLWFALGVTCLACTWIITSRRARLLPLAGCICVVLVSNAASFLHFHSTSPNAFVFAKTPALAELRTKLGARRPIFMGATGLPPRVAALHEIPSLTDVRGAELARVERLRRAWFVRGENGHDTTWAARRGLRFFGIECVIGDDEWVALDTWTGFADRNADLEYLTRSLVPDADVEFDFRCVDESASALRVCFETGGRPLLQNIELNVVDRKTRELLSQRVLAPDFQRPNALPRVFESMPLPRLEDWRTRDLMLVVRSNDGVPESAWSLVARRDWQLVMNAGFWRHEGVAAHPTEVRHPAFHGFKARQDGRELRGAIVVDMTWTTSALHAAGVIGPRRLFEFQPAVPIFRTVSRALAARDAEDAFQATIGLRFDPARAVVIEGIERDLVSDAGEADAAVEVMEQSDSWVRLRTTRGNSGWLVMSQPWYPGWRATVNGVEHPILHANYAFGVIEIGAGESDILLEYRPTSARIGAAVAWLALALLGTWLALSRGSRLSGAARSA